MTEKGPGCEGCKFLLRQDNGWSNWTVDGSEVECLKNLNPEMPLSDDVEGARFNRILAFGESCGARVEGDGPWFDVDGEATAEDYKEDAELYALLKERQA